jgi:hypothetical protein
MEGKTRRTDTNAGLCPCSVALDDAPEARQLQSLPDDYTPRKRVGWVSFHDAIAVSSALVE